MAFCQIHGDTFSWLQFLFDSCFYLGFSNSGVVIAIQLWDLRTNLCYILVAWRGIWRDWFDPRLPFRTDCRWGMIWYVIWMALVSRNSIRLALICVPPFGCGRLHTWVIFPLFDGRSARLIDWLLAFGFCKFDTFLFVSLSFVPFPFSASYMMTLHALEHFLWSFVVW